MAGGDGPVAGLEALELDGEGFFDVVEVLVGLGPFGAGFAEDEAEAVVGEVVEGPEEGGGAVFASADVDDVGLVWVEILGGEWFGDR